MGVFGWVSGALFLGMQAWAFPSPESGKNNKKQADYLDPHSGIMLPGQVQLFKQSYLKSDWPMKGVTCAFYETVDYTEGLGHMLNWYAVKAEVRIVPSPASSAMRVVEIMLRAVKDKHPDFKGATYDGETVFGGTQAVCGQGSMAVPARSDRAIVQVIVVPKGRFLVAFRFIFSGSRQRNFEPEIGAFVKNILGGHDH